MKKLVLALFLFILSCALSMAQVSPGSTCITSGGVTLSSPPGYLMPCNGSTYVLGEAISNSGQIGINQSTPAAQLDVNGGIRMGSDSAVCSSTNGGEIQYNSNSVLSFCNATSWSTLSVASSASSCASPTSSTLSSGSTTVSVGVGCTVIFKAWGGGGGGGYSTNSTSFGGGGGYATITLGPLGTATTYYLYVGGGGNGVSPSCTGGTGETGFTGGTGELNTGNNICYGGGGGGASGVWTGSYGGTAVIIAAGGGGAGGGSGVAGTAGGAYINLSHLYSSSVGQADTASKGGGGGAGYPYGGTQPTSSGYGAYGGESYAASGGGTMGGTGQAAGGTGDSNYTSGVGVGGNSEASGASGAIYYITY